MTEIIKQIITKAESTITFKNTTVTIFISNNRLNLKIGDNKEIFTSFALQESKPKKNGTFYYKGYHDDFLDKYNELSNQLNNKD